MEEQDKYQIGEWDGPDATPEELACYEQYERWLKRMSRAWFPYRPRRGGVHIPLLGTFKNRDINTGGPDPYSGVTWTLRHRWFTVKLTDVVIAEVRLDIGGRQFRWVGAPFQTLPWPLARIWE